MTLGEPSLSGVLAGLAAFVACLLLFYVVGVLGSRDRKKEEDR